MEGDFALIPERPGRRPLPSGNSLPSLCKAGSLG